MSAESELELAAAASVFRAKVWMLLRKVSARAASAPEDFADLQRADARLLTALGCPPKSTQEQKQCR